MLRDLDQRQAGQVSNPARALSGDPAARGTSPVQTQQRLRSRSALWYLMGAVLLLLVASAGWWWYQSLTQPRVPQSVAPPSPSAAVQVVAPAVPISAPVAIMTKPVDPKPLPAPVSVPKRLSRVDPRAAAAAPDTAVGTLRMDSSLLHLPVHKKVAPPPAVASPAMGVPQATLVRPAALEALAQAQSLWNAGSHAVAIELLGQALSRIESSTPAGVPVPKYSALASLAPELARMQVADGQVGQALALLKRLEPQLAPVAQAWAMRGNAAQRLGQHAEAVHSYQRALALRPDETRWMLGAAVSLAAQGQTAAAGEWADKARVMGALRPELAAYLRQLGVTIHTD